MYTFYNLFSKLLTNGCKMCIMYLLQVVKCSACFLQLFCYVFLQSGSRLTLYQYYIYKGVHYEQIGIDRGNG